MKKNLFFLILISLSLSGYSQFGSTVAVDDTLYYDFGETYTVNVIANDYDTAGLELKIRGVAESGENYEILSFSDSTITFTMKDYIVSYGVPLNIKLPYHLESDAPIFPYANINLFHNLDHIDTLDVNQISTPVYPMNNQFFDVFDNFGDNTFRFPKDSLTSTIFNSTLWIGGNSADNNLHVAAERYRQVGQDFWPGPLSADGNATTDSLNAGNWLRTWKVSREEINQHIASYNDPNYKMPEAIENWPAHGEIELGQDEFLAPFVDVDLDLKYNPQNGDYPFIKGDVTVFFIINDQLTHTETGGLSLGVEIHCMAWAINPQRGDSPYDHTIFYSYKIINRSNIDYNDTYIGLFTDFDLGYAWDDFIGCHVENGNFYVYNGDDFDETKMNDYDTTYGYGNRIPSQSVMILGGPFMDEDGIDNPIGGCDVSINGAGFGDNEVDNERYGMNRFVYHNNTGAAAITDPQYAIDYYNFMRGIWKDSTHMVFGGEGHQDYGGDINIPTKFMFPGDSDPCNWGTGGVDPGYVWSEEASGNNPGDRRGLASMGPFTFETGSVEYIDIAYVTAPYSSDKESKEMLQDMASQIKQDYLENPMDFGFQYTGIEEAKIEAKLLEVYPNPVNGDQIWFELDEQNESDYVIYNAAGQVAQNGKLAAQKQHQLNVGSLDAGWYLLEIKSSDKTYRSKLIK